MAMTKDQERYVGVGAGVLTAVAAALPWASVKTVFGSISVSGLDNSGDGIFTALLGLLGALMIWRCTKVTLWIAVIAGVLITAIALWDISDINGRINDLESEADGFATASVGVGLYLTVVTGVVLFAVAVTLLRAQRTIREELPPMGGTKPLPPPPPPAVPPSF